MVQGCAQSLSPSGPVAIVPSHGHSRPSLILILDPEFIPDIPTATGVFCCLGPGGARPNNLPELV